MKYISHESYEDYVKQQTITNKAKINNVWAVASNMKDIKNYCDEHNINVINILCHGTRNGAELQYFQNNFPDSGVLGTDISDTATQFPNTVQWDFHNVNDDWTGQFDIVYTNSWDHAYDFEKALDVWMGQLTDTGRLFLDWNEDTSKPFNQADCCGCSKEELIELLEKKYVVESDGFAIENRYGKEAYMIVVKK